MSSGPDAGDRSRFAKLGMAINEELTQACRDVLEMEVPPGLVYNKVKSSSVYKNIRPEQELRLIGAKTDGYKQFDITLLYTLIRNVCTKIPRPTKGWGGNTMPAIGQITTGDDVERIRLLRNSMFGHISSASTSKTDFDNTWSVITDICQRLQTCTKKDYISGLSNIQRQTLEEENETTVIEKLREDYKNNQCLMEKMSFLEQDLLESKLKSENKENTLVKDILQNWQEEDIAFIPTRASEVVEEKLKSQNLIALVGNSGSGKSAIIQHIALKYKERGWNVIPVNKVEEIKTICSNGVSETRFLFVFNDPLGKESLDEISYHSWKSFEEMLEMCLKRNKLLISCRRCVFYDKRVKGILVDESTAVEIDNEENGLTVEEKRAIFYQYSQNMKLTQNIETEILKTDAYFPLLCKLFSREANYKEKGVDFFKNPYKFIKREIEIWKKTDKKKFCSLMLIVAFKNNLKIDTIVRSDISMMKYKEILGMCELQENTHISVIRSTLNELKGSYVKRVGHGFQFLHDFVMEITTLVFGIDCPQGTMQYADSGFLRRGVRIEDDTEEEDRDPFTVYLPEEYIGDLVDRFIIDMQTERLIDVLLNPCLRKESVIKTFKEKVDSLEKLLVRIKWKIDRSEFPNAFEGAGLSKIRFLDWKDEICPLVGFIIFCHNEISSFFLKGISETKLKEYPIFSALCANSDLNLIDYLSEEYKKASIMEMWGSYLPIHIASVFHNFSIIQELVKFAANVNKFTTYGNWTPLMLAAANDDEHLRETGLHTKEGERRNKTILCLLNNGADINLCNKNGSSPLLGACEFGNDSTVQLLLNKGSDINLSNKNGFSPLYKACQNGHASTAQLLLSNGADINLCNNNGVSPLYIACQNGHDSTVQLLLNNGADINLCEKNGASPLYKACKKGYDSIVQFLLKGGADINLSCYKEHVNTVQLLLKNGAYINLCDNDGTSPLFIACYKEHVNTVQLLLNNGADINLCDCDGCSPLHAASHNGYDSIVQLLLNNDAEINLCNKNGTSPLYVACQNKHDSTVQLLLKGGADINVCNKYGASPFYLACYNEHDSMVQLLLNKGADINLRCDNGPSPLYLACYNGHDSLVQQLVNNGANLNLSDNDGVSPLYMACQGGHDDRVQLLLSNGADINLCNNYGVNPLHVACYYGHISTVQLLLKNGANISLCDKSGASALWIACLNEHDTTIQLLLDNGADINLSDNNGTSPLYMSRQKGYDSTVQLLLNYGANKNLCDN
ncbi:ankyrin repeat domain-containing protein 17-like [Saccostrea cucullata]|uniref:ankyrin repeat domain-containing protein 17-like n=1 Tax=Saccostrea cuccullata TaxID=36930 RepID=UPI002ED13C09